MTQTGAPAHIREMFASRIATAQQTEATTTETVTVAELKAGDVITELDGKALPFPFTLTVVTPMPKRGLATMRAQHGWFTMTPVALAATVERAA